MPHTLLIADDSTTIQRVVTLMLADEDIKVVAVGDGEQALEAIRRMSPDILLADVDMPGCSGYELADRVRKANPGQRLPVLLLAGAFDPVDRERAIACGADGVLTKPFDPAVLVARVKELLPGHAIDSPHTPAGTVSAPSPAPGDAAQPLAALSTSGEGAGRTAAGLHHRPSPDVDRYFEQLDAAFATLAQQPRLRPGTVAAATRDDATDRAELGDTAADTDAATEAAGPALPLADAFAALLAAEEAGFVPAGAPAAAVAGGLAATDVDRLAELVAERVLARLTDQALRDTVTDIVATTAERLVREEIEQIKRHIK